METGANVGLKLHERRGREKKIPMAKVKTQTLGRGSQSVKILRKGESQCKDTKEEARKQGNSMLNPIKLLP